MRRDDKIRLRHMYDASCEASSFIRGKTKVVFENDRMLVLAVLKELEIIGEAASKVSDETRAECTEIPWADIIGMRHRLIHAYFDINLAIVWQTVTQDLPQLTEMLDRVLSDGTDDRAEGTS